MKTRQYFSDDIVEEISIYLPAKSLMRFKCVSKAWNTTMQDPNFVRSHYARSQDRPSATQLLFQLKTYNKSCLDIGDLVDLSLQLDYFGYDGEITICSNHCNGLVCLYSYKDTQVYLYNATTREIKALPPYVNGEIKFNPNEEQPSYRELLLRFSKLFLGFDQVVGNYKLLLLFPHQAKEPKILTLGVTNSSWRKVDLLNNDHRYSRLYSYRDCIFLNGVLYMIWSTYMAYFDFGKEKFGYISPPPQTNYYFERQSLMQTALWGQLVVMCSSNPRCGPPTVFGYDDANKVFIPLENRERLPRPINISLSGTERINDNTKEAHVLATTSVIIAPAFPLSYVSLPCPISFVRHNNENTRPDIVFTFVSRFVENIIPLNSLLV